MAKSSFPLHTHNRAAVLTEVYYCTWEEGFFLIAPVFLIPEAKRSGTTARSLPLGYRARGFDRRY